MATSVDNAPVVARNLRHREQKWAPRLEKPRAPRWAASRRVSVLPRASVGN